MADKTRHAFGTLEKIDESIQKGIINEFDVLYVKDANGNPYIGWIDENGEKVIFGGNNSSSGESVKEIVRVDTLPTENGNPDVIYIYNNKMYIWDGEKCTSDSVNEEMVKNIIKEYSDELIQDATDSDIESLFP